jgi:hypothetical protein
VFYTGFVTLCGRKRYNVLGAFNPINHEVITITNDNYVNQAVLCEFLEKMSETYHGTEQPMTLI